MSGEVISVTALITINYNHLEGTISPFLSGAQSLHFLTTSSSQCDTSDELQLFKNHHDRALPQKSFH
jgi:hypothetical protein